MNIIHDCGVLVGRIVRGGTRDEWSVFRRGIRAGLLGVAIVAASAVALDASLGTHLVQRIRIAPAKPWYPMLRPTAHMVLGTTDNDNACYLDGTVDGVPFHFLFSTNASYDLFFSRTAIRKVGIDPDKLDYRWTLNTAAGPVRAASVAVDDITLGGYLLHRPNWPVIIYVLADMSRFGFKMMEMSLEPADGAVRDFNTGAVIPLTDIPLLGMGLLRRYDMHFASAPVGCELGW